MSYSWSVVSKVMVNQLQLAKITQAIPDILALNVSAQSSRSFWSGQKQLMAYCSMVASTARAAVPHVHWII